MSEPRNRQILVGLGLLGLTLITLKGALFLGGAFYERDLLSIYFPMAETFVRAINGGALPLRDPSTGFGQPMLGNPDAQIAYPPTWLHLLMLPEMAYAVFLLLHFFLAATGAAALAWRVSGSSRASFLAGAFWLVGGPLPSFLTLWHHLAGAAWMPWVLTAFDRTLETTDRRNRLLLAFAFGMQILAGSAEMCAMTLALAVLRLACEASSASAVRLAGQFKAALSSLSVALCLGAATWLSVADVWRFSNRAALPEDVRTYWSVHPWMLFDFFMPVSLGSLDLGPETRNLLFAAPAPFLKSLFLGALALPLFLGALASSRIAVKYRAFAGVGAIVAVLFSFGKYTPFYGALTTALPFLAIFRYPVKAMIPLSLLVLVLGAVAVSRLGDGKDSRVARIVALVLLAVHAALLVRLPEVLPELVRAASVSTLARNLVEVRANLLVSSCLLILLAMGTSGRRRHLVALAAFASVLATLVFHRDLNPVVDRSALRYRPESVDGLKTSEPSRLYVEDYVNFPDLSRQFLGRPAPFQAMRPADPGQTAAFVVSLRSLLIPPVGATWGLEYGWDADLRKLFSHTLHDLTIGLRIAEGTPEFLRMLQLGNVSRVVALHTSTFSLLKPNRAIPSPLPEPLYVFDVPDPLPRAYAVSGVRVMETPLAAKAVLDPDFRPAREVILDGGTARPESTTFESSVSVASRRADRITLEVKLNEPGTVVLIEGFLPGWNATIDGVAVPVLRANALFVAVWTSAGEHRVVFTYRPWPAVIGIWLSGLTALALLIGLTRERRGAPA